MRSSSICQVRLTLCVSPLAFVPLFKFVHGALVKELGAKHVPTPLA